MTSNVNGMKQFAIVHPYEGTAGGNASRLYLLFQFPDVADHADLHLVALFRRHGRKPETRFIEHAWPHAHPCPA